MRSRTEVILRREKMEITLPVLIDQFCATKQIEGKAPKTVSWYRDCLLRFTRHQGEDIRLPSFTLENARAFIAVLQEQKSKWIDHPRNHEQEGKLPAFTIHGYIRALKVFSTWLFEEGYASHNILLRLKKPKLPQPLIEVLTNEELDRIISVVNPSCFLGARQYAIVLLLLDTGIRASELCTLKLADADLNRGTLKVCGKGNKERIVPFGAATKKALLRYINTFRPEPDPNADTLILSTDGTELSYWGLMHIMRRLSTMAGIPRLHAHLFRHTFAVRYLLAGGDVMTLRLILGHTSLEVTKVYLHIAEVDLKLAHERFSPADRLFVGKRRRVS
jgi:site-specific recombinase XerD